MFKRIVVLMMENHSFDRMLGWMQPKYGVDGVDPLRPRSNPGPDGRPVEQSPTSTPYMVADPKHLYDNVIRQMANGSSGYVTDFDASYPDHAALWAEVMAWYAEGAQPALHFLAKNFVVCDRWFSSVPGPTWPNRFFAHSGTSHGRLDMPENAAELAAHVYTQRTIYQELSANGLGWRVYYGDVSQTLALAAQWPLALHYHPYAFFANDAKKGDLPEYVFIEPHYFGKEQNDQHPPSDVRRGDKLIASVYEALRANPALFAETLLVVVYDEHGGFYDHVEPPATVAPDDHVADNGFAFDRLGPRVPAILVSPLLDQTVTHTTLDHTSILRMAADLWPGVEPLGARAKAANSPLAGLKLRETPRTMPACPVLPEPPESVCWAPLNGQQKALAALAEMLHLEITDTSILEEVTNRTAALTEGAHGLGELVRTRLMGFFHQKQRESLSQGEREEKTSPMHERLQPRQP